MPRGLGLCRVEMQTLHDAAFRTDASSAASEDLPGLLSSGTYSLALKGQLVPFDARLLTPIVTLAIIRVSADVARV